MNDTQWILCNSCPVSPTFKAMQWLSVLAVVISSLIIMCTYLLAGRSL